MSTNLLQGFRVRNFRSIGAEQTIVFTRRERDADNAFDDPQTVPVAAIFGANASGKSNLLRALRTAHGIIRHSANRETPLPFEPFRLGAEINPTTTFELDVVLDGIRYSYEFTFNADRIMQERLLSWPKGRQRMLYERDSTDDDEWRFGDSLGGANASLVKATRPSALGLSTARLIQHDLLGPIQEKFVELIRMYPSEEGRGDLARTLELIQADAGLRNRVAGLLSRADIGVTDLEVREDEQAQKFRDSALQLFRSLQEQQTDLPFVFEDDQNRILVPMLKHRSPQGGVSLPFGVESLGTQAFVALLGPVLERLASGGVLAVDEVDTSLHPRLVNEIVRLFQDPRINRRQAQLILTTHDVTVMMNTGDYGVLKRDQIWIVRKLESGETDLYPLLDFSVRASEVFSRGYLMDRYGGIPKVDRDSFYRFLIEDPTLGGDTQGGLESPQPVENT